MQEKKLTNEEIIKALECCIKEEHKYCVHCGEFVSQFDCMRNSISNALDLIHRLQSENERLTEDWKQRINKARQRQFNGLKKEELASSYEKLIESLEGELESRQNDYVELQTKVDELKQENSVLSVTIGLQEEIEKQAVKDTAKEICKMAKRHNRDSQINIERLIMSIEATYGVEVE